MTRMHLFIPFIPPEPGAWLNLAHFVTRESLTMGEQGKTHWSHTLGPSDGCTTLCLGPKWNIPGARGNAQIW